MTPVQQNFLKVRTNYFEFGCVDGNEAVEESYQLRYQVYCVERGFLDPDDYPDAMEADQFDPHSVHFLGKHRFTGVSAGTARLVLHSDAGFPMQEHCSFSPEFEHLNPGARDTSLTHYAEISRLAVSRQFRQRAGDTNYGGPPRSATDGWVRDNESQVPKNPGISPVAAGPEIVAGIYKCLYQESKRLRLSHWVVAMERSLRLLLRRMGYRFHQIGPDTDYFGPVAPFIADIAVLERTVFETRPEVFRFCMLGLEPELRPDYAAALDLDDDTSRDHHNDQMT